MDISGICFGGVVVVGVIFVALAVIRRHHLSVVQKREILVYREVERVLRLSRAVYRESLIRRVRKRLSVVNPKLSDWTYEINTAISQMIEQGRAEERMGIIYASFPPDDDA